MAKGKYVDGFVIPIPKKNTAQYMKMARDGCRAWKKFGALDFKECILEDEKPAFFKITRSPRCREQKGDGLFCEEVR